MMNFFLLLIFTFSSQILWFPLEASSATDKFTSVQSLQDGQNLLSNGGNFILGFFSPGSSKNRFLGLWYINVPNSPVVWVANRDHPINDTSGILMINNSTGNLVIVSHNGAVKVWSSNSSRTTDNPMVQLMYTGNIVLRDEKYNEGDSSKYLWQSFDYPSDTLLPEMKVGWDLRTGLNRRLTSWKSPDDPSPGEYSAGLENPYPERYVKKGLMKVTRSGPWNGLEYSGVPELTSNLVYSINFTLNRDEAYYITHLKIPSRITRLVIDGMKGQLIRYIWNEASSSWSTVRIFPIDLCDTYEYCGPYGVCSISETPVCKCLEGFQPKSLDKWSASLDWTQGCVRTKPLNCSMRTEFVKLTGFKLPDTTNSWLNQSMNLAECKAKCLSNCSCTAYSNSDIRGAGSGCAIWFGDLIDIRKLATGGQVMYIRMPFSNTGHRSKMKKLPLIALAGILLIPGIITLVHRMHRRKQISRAPVEVPHHVDETVMSMKDKDLELLVFDLATIMEATDNFSLENKLGEGGFGPVYKGTTADGLDIAVKRLSKSSVQGQNEFKNEVILIAKLQHRNLVKLLGCYLEGTERMLVYEYMPNRSLDHFIFDQARKKLIDWSKRFEIICGIARGLLYLHQDSRLRIIHRDLKASNILLDDEMNPKISDFGLAKIFGGDQTEGNTNRVVGTYGYMAPEYATDGVFSVKSDVFSFGILLLEIVTGVKNRGLYQKKHTFNLIGHAWTQWQHDRSLELIDESSVGAYNSIEVLRCIQIGLLCVQQHPEDRPNMSLVVVMLSSEIELPEPQQPAFFTSKSIAERPDHSSSSYDSCTVNEVTVTRLQPR